MAQYDVDVHLGKRYEDRLIKGLGDLLSLVSGLPFTVKVLVAFRKQQMVRPCLIYLYDIATKLKVVDEIGLGAAPIGFVNQFLKRKGGGIRVARQTLVNAQ